MRKGALAGVLVALLTGLLVAAAPGVGDAGDNRDLSAKLTGRAEVPGPGDPDGKGRAEVTLGKGEVCFELRWEGIDAPHMAHIHKGEKDVAGPIVVAFFMQADPLPAGFSAVRGCVDAPADLLDEIGDHPDDFYVNIHNLKYPAGAIRGQLHH